MTACISCSIASGLSSSGIASRMTCAIVVALFVSTGLWGSVFGGGYRRCSSGLLYFGGLPHSQQRAVMVGQLWAYLLNTLHALGDGWPGCLL